MVLRRMRHYCHSYRHIILPPYVFMSSNVSIGKFTVVCMAGFRTGQAGQLPTGPQQSGGLHIFHEKQISKETLGRPERHARINQKPYCARISSEILSPLA